VRNCTLILFATIFIAFVSEALAQSPQRGLAVAPNPTNSSTWGTYHALIIGINDYEKWPRLQTAVKDATVIRDTLVSRYGFDPKHVILRTDKDASRRNITRDIRYLARSMRKDDNLFIYYAGHGQLDDFTGDGYWVPAEGALKNPDTWVANSYIKAILSSEKLEAKNVVVIADSCYSGSMLRGGPSLMSLDDQRYTEKLAEKASLRSRQVISSGGVEPVADGGAEGHSLFAYYFIDALRKNQREVIDLENLFHTKVWTPVTEIGDQRPNVGRIRTPMDQDGQFVLYNAAWARDQAARRAALEAKQQEQTAAKRKMDIASAELELQRQRFEMEKQKLALEKEQLAQQKAIELERLKLERQKQEVEYAKMQAKLAEMETKRKLAEQPQMMAAVDKRVPDNRLAVRTRYKVALFPVKARSDYGKEELLQRNTIGALTTVADNDERLKFSLSYRSDINLPDTVELLSNYIDGQDQQVWKKPSFFSQFVPDWDRLEKVSAKLDIDLAVMVNINHTIQGHIDVYLYDCKRKKKYSHLKAQLVRGGLRDYLQVVLRDFYRDQK